MKNKRDYVLACITCFLPVIIGLILYPKFPDKVAIHWGMNGEANNYASKFVGILLLPMILSIVCLFTPYLISLDPKNKELNDKLRKTIIWILPVINVMCSSVTILKALGKDIKVETIVPLIVGIIFVIIGNYLPKTKQNYTVGVKIPWTLNDEDNWNKTHRFAGFVFVIGGLILIVTSLTIINVAILLIDIFLIALLPVIYSYILYKNAKIK